MKRGWMIAVGLLAALGLSVTAALAAAPPKPPVGLRETFQGCKWEEVKARGVSVWSCNTRELRLVADDRLPGLVLEERGKRADGPAIRLFKKAANAPLASVLLQVRAASPGRYTPRCEFKPWPTRKESRGRYFALEPTAAAARQWEASQKTSVMPDQPCGPLGIGYVGDKYFEVVPGDPTSVVFVDKGSEIQIFDPETIRTMGRTGGRR